MENMSCTWQGIRVLREGTFSDGREDNKLHTVKFLSKEAVYYVTQLESYRRANNRLLQGCSDKGRVFFSFPRDFHQKSFELTGFTKLDLVQARRSLKPVRVCVANNCYYFTSKIGKALVDHIWHDMHGIHSHIGIGEPGNKEAELRLTVTKPLSEPPLKKMLYRGKFARPAPTLTIASDDMRAAIEINAKLIDALRQFQSDDISALDKANICSVLNELIDKKFPILEHFFIAYRDKRENQFKVSTTTSDIQKQICKEFNFILASRTNSTKINSCEMWHTVMVQTSESDLCHYQRSSARQSIADVNIFTFFEGSRQLKLHQLYIDEKLGRCGIGMTSIRDVRQVTYERSKNDDTLSSTKSEQLRECNSFRVPKQKELVADVDAGSEFRHHPIVELVNQTGNLAAIYKSIPRFCVGVEVNKSAEPETNRVSRAVHKKLAKDEAFTHLSYEVESSKRGNCNSGIGSLLRNAHEMKMKETKLNFEVAILTDSCLATCQRTLEKLALEDNDQDDSLLTDSHSSVESYEDQVPQKKLAVLESLSKKVGDAATTAKEKLEYDFVEEFKPPIGASCSVYAIRFSSYNAVGVSHLVKFWNPLNKPH